MIRGGKNKVAQTETLGLDSLSSQLCVIVSKRRKAGRRSCSDLRLHPLGGQVRGDGPCKRKVNFTNNRIECSGNKNMISLGTWRSGDSPWQVRARGLRDPASSCLSEMEVGSGPHTETFTDVVAPDFRTNVAAKVATCSLWFL